jgi:hypothetical protein
LPELGLVNSNEVFGVVDSQNALSFGGLFEIKQEEDENENDLLDTIESTETLPDVLNGLEIDPTLLTIPEPTKAASHHPKPKAVPVMPASMGVEPTKPAMDSIVSTLLMKARRHTC